MSQWWRKFSHASHGRVSIFLGGPLFKNKPIASVGLAYIYLYIYHKNKANVDKYAIHGWHGLRMDGRKKGFRKGGLSNILGV